VHLKEQGPQALRPKPSALLFVGTVCAIREGRVTIRKDKIRLPEVWPMLSGIFWSSRRMVRFWFDVWQRLQAPPNKNEPNVERVAKSSLS